MPAKPAVWRLEWMDRRDGYHAYTVADDFVLRVEPAYQDWQRRGDFVAAVINPFGGSALYRSTRTFDLETAKAECIRQGAKVARRLARQYAEVAAILAGDA